MKSPFALAFVRAPVFRGWGASAELRDTSQLLRPLTLCLRPSGGCPHPRRPGHLDPTQRHPINLCLRHSEQLSSGPFPFPKGQMAITRSSPTPAPVHTPELQGGRRQQRLPQGAGSHGVCGSLDPGPSHPRTPGWFQKGLTQASAQSHRAGPSRVGVWALACANSTQPR